MFPEFKLCQTNQLSETHSILTSDTLSKAPVMNAVKGKTSRDVLTGANFLILLGRFLRKEFHAPIHHTIRNNLNTLKILHIFKLI